jgi:2,3-bisphosphoglycerate-independent phosphoglycerate mutase
VTVAAPPIVLVILDGLGDRPLEELGGRTPSEAAATPNLDAFAAAGASGLHVPFGPGRAPTSEVAHWSLFGFAGVPFPGRAVLEALGHGREVPAGVPLFYACLRPLGDGLAVGDYAEEADAADAALLFEALSEPAAECGFAFDHLRRGEALLWGGYLESAEITDTEPMLPGEPWSRPLPRAGAARAAEARRAAAAMESLLRRGHRLLAGHPVNDRRAGEGRARLEAITTKWGGARAPLPTFRDLVGLRGGAVTTSAMYRGLAALLEMDAREAGKGDLAVEMELRLGQAEQLLDEGCEFVHVHTKATDEAGHSKDPFRKRDTVEALDRGLAGLAPLARRAVICVTGDHATPSSGGLPHSGDPTPLAIAGPSLRPDPVRRFGESHARAGELGTLAAGDVLPALCGHADRARQLGHHPGPYDTLAVPTATPEDWLDGRGSAG